MTDLDQFDAMVATMPPLPVAAVERAVYHLTLTREQWIAARVALKLAAKDARERAAHLQERYPDEAAEARRLASMQESAYRALDVNCDYGMRP